MFMEVRVEDEHAAAVRWKPVPFHEGFSELSSE
jgi:hypothetical protein